MINWEDIEKTYTYQFGTPEEQTNIKNSYLRDYIDPIQDPAEKSNLYQRVFGEPIPGYEPPSEPKSPLSMEGLQAMIGHTVPGNVLEGFMTRIAGEPMTMRLPFMEAPTEPYTPGPVLGSQTLGNIVYGAGSVALDPLNYPAILAGPLGMAGQGALQVASEEFAKTGEAPTEHTQLLDIAKGAATYGVAGLAGGLGGKALGKVAEGITPAARPVGEFLGSAGTMGAAFPLMEGRAPTGEDIGTAGAIAAIMGVPNLVKGRPSVEQPTSDVAKAVQDLAEAKKVKPFYKAQVEHPQVLEPEALRLSSGQVLPLSETPMRTETTQVPVEEVKPIEPTPALRPGSGQGVEEPIRPVETSPEVVPQPEVLEPSTVTTPGVPILIEDVSNLKTAIDQAPKGSDQFTYLEEVQKQLGWDDVRLNEAVRQASEQGVIEPSPDVGEGYTGKTYRVWEEESLPVGRVRTVEPLSGEFSHRREEIYKQFGEKPPDQEKLGKFESFRPEWSVEKNMEQVDKALTLARAERRLPVDAAHYMEDMIRSGELSNQTGESKYDYPVEIKESKGLRRLGEYIRALTGKLPPSSKVIESELPEKWNQLRVKVGTVGEFLDMPNAKKLSKEVLDTPVYLQNFNDPKKPYANFSPGRKEITLNVANPYNSPDYPLVLAATLTHEAVHAEQMARGRKLDRKTYGRYYDKPTEYMADRLSAIITGVDKLLPVDKMVPTRPGYQAPLRRLEEYVQDKSVSAQTRKHMFNIWNNGTPEQKKILDDYVNVEDTLINFKKKYHETVLENEQEIFNPMWDEQRAALVTRQRTLLKELMRC